MVKLPGPEQISTVSPRAGIIPRVPSIPENPTGLLGAAAVDAIARITASQNRRNQLEETLFIDRAGLEYAARRTSDNDLIDNDPSFPKSTASWLAERERLRGIARAEFDQRTSPHGMSLSADRIALKYDEIDARITANGSLIHRDAQGKEAIDALEAIGNKHATDVRNTGNLAAAMIGMETDFAPYSATMDADPYRDAWASSYKNVVRAAIMGHARGTRTEEAKSLVNDKVFGRFFSEAEKDTLINAVDAIGEDVRIRTEALAAFENLMGEELPEDQTVEKAREYPDVEVGAVLVDLVMEQFAAGRRADADKALKFSREAMEWAELGLLDSIGPATPLIGGRPGDMSPGKFFFDREKANFLGTDMIRLRGYSRKRALDEPIETDWKIYNILRSGAVDPKAFSKIDLYANYRTVLSDTEYKEMVKYQEIVRQSLVDGTEGDIISGTTQIAAAAKALGLENDPQALGEFQIEAHRRFAAYKVKNGSNPDDSARLAILNEMTANRAVTKPPPKDTGTVDQFVIRTVARLGGDEGDQIANKDRLWNVVNSAAYNKREDLAPADLEAIGTFFRSKVEFDPKGGWNRDIKLLEAAEKGLLGPGMKIDGDVSKVVPQEFIEDYQDLFGRGSQNIVAAYWMQITYDPGLTQLMLEQVPEDFIKEKRDLGATDALIVKEFVSLLREKREAKAAELKAKLEAKPPERN